MNPQFESLGNKWYSLTKDEANIRAEAMEYMKKVLSEGGTRDKWNISENDTDTMLME